MATDEHAGLTRRDLLRAAAGATLAAHAPLPPAPAAAATMRGVPFARHDVARLAIVGTGGRGTSLLEEFLRVEGVRVTALADIVEATARHAAALVTAAGQPEPALFTRGERDFEALVRRDDVDFVVIATPWAWHVPMAVAAMQAGRHCGVEVPAAVTLEECWTLVDVSERTRRHCMILENCCYGYNELLVLNLVRAGVLGEVLHGECAYIHDLRAILLADEGEGLWRRIPHERRNGNLYPTHGLGPVARYMDIHRGDRLDYLVSMSSPERGLTLYRDAHAPAGSPKHRERYRTGDMNTSLVKTVRGRTIVLQHDVVSPRPYDRINLISGTKGIFRDYPPRIHVEGRGEPHRFGTLDEYKAGYEHDLWRTVGELARTQGGHGGMDLVMAWRLVQCLREGLAPDMDVYDAAAWSAPGPLSEASVRKGSAPVKFPDFTRGHWARA
ncbi:MAG TPA: Gfo/Idh/MocA family oxidoreductase [Gemmatimonadales bacterium]|nr:Gfo/Idh/MocA family oxidoreductase [Gemmatimonadales bacterium]